MSAFAPPPQRRKCRGVKMEWRYLSDKISNGFNSALLIGIILMDFQKAFDTIDHYILLQNFPLLRFSNEVIGWFKSYLHSRKFHVNVHDKFTTTAELRCGVLQGSILGPFCDILTICHRS